MLLNAESGVRAHYLSWTSESVITEPGDRGVTIPGSGLAECGVRSPGCAPVLGMTLSATISGHSGQVSVAGAKAKAGMLGHMTFHAWNWNSITYRKKARAQRERERPNDRSIVGGAAWRARASARSSCDH